MGGARSDRREKRLKVSDEGPSGLTIHPTACKRLMENAHGANLQRAAPQWPGQNGTSGNKFDTAPLLVSGIGGGLLVGVPWRKKSCHLGVDKAVLLFGNSNSIDCSAYKFGV